MMLEVRQHVIPLNNASIWEQRPYDVTVWKHDGIIPLKLSVVPVPHDYVRGLLSTYIDGNKVDLPIFDAALSMIMVSRRDIEIAIAAQR